MKRAILKLLVATAVIISFNAGCVTSRVIKDTTEPDIVIDDFGTITYKGKRVELEVLARTIRASGIKRNQEVTILVPECFDTLRRNQVYSQMLSGGYTRTIFVTDRKATSYTTGIKPQK